MILTLAFIVFGLLCFVAGIFFEDVFRVKEGKLVRK